MKEIDRVISALYHQAIADAVGADFEFVLFPDQNEVRSIYRSGKLGITDDTQMTLFGFQALARGECTPSGLVKTWSDWYKTQLGKFSVADLAQPGLLGYPCMYKRKAPGNACLEAAVSGKAVPDARGCGTVMRMLPFAFAHIWGVDSREACFLNSRSTHLSNDVEEATDLYLEIVKLLVSGGTQDDLYALISPLIEDDSDISGIGGGWRATECVLMAAWACSKATDFEDLLTISICHAGDSDSVAAVAGAFWGLTHESPDKEMLGRLLERGPIEYCKALWEGQANAPVESIEGKEEAFVPVPPGT